MLFLLGQEGRGLGTGEVSISIAQQTGNSTTENTEDTEVVQGKLCKESAPPHSPLAKYSGKINYERARVARAENKPSRFKFLARYRGIAGAENKPSALEDESHLPQSFGEGPTRDGVEMSHFRPLNTVIDLIGIRRLKLRLRSREIWSLFRTTRRCSRANLSKHDPRYSTQSG